MQQDRSEEWLPLRGRWLEYFWRGLLVPPLVALVLAMPLCVRPVTLRQARNGQAGAAVTQMRNFKTAIELYAADYGRPPSDLCWLVSPPTIASRTTERKGPYLNDVTTVPLDPWQHPYEYEALGPHGESFRILCYGSDGRPGGEGTAADLNPDSRVKDEPLFSGWYHKVKWR